jgi:hypothetical protein
MPDTEKIRELNDQFRRTMTGGRVVVTNGIANRSDLPQIIENVRHFTDFDSGNDPYAEHDFGAFEMGKDSIFWKIDYYDRALAAGSENPADESITCRVLTILRADEY